MTTSMTRTALVLTSSAGLMVGTAVSAGAVASSSDYRPGNRSGYVRVCQDIRDDGDRGLKSARDHEDDSDFVGRYRVRDSEGDSFRIRLSGRHDCSGRIRVHTGRVRVRVVDEPEDTRLRSSDEQTVRVRRGETERVTFRYVERDEDRALSVG
jgi:hypothetical protein